MRLTKKQTKEFVNYVEAWRIGVKLSLKEFAQKSGVPHSSWYMHRKGLRKYMQIKTKTRILKFIDNFDSYKAIKLKKNRKIELEDRLVSEIIELKKQRNSYRNLLLIQAVLLIALSIALILTNV